MSTFGLTASLRTEVAHDLVRHRRAVTLALLLQFVDVASTRACLDAGMQEANVATAKALGLFGEVGMYGMKLTVAAAVIAGACLLGRRYPGLWRALRWANAVMVLVVLLNITQLLLGL